MTPLVCTHAISWMLVTRVNPAAHSNDINHSRFTFEIFFVFRSSNYALTCWEVTGLVSPVEVDLGAGHEHHELPSSVLLTLGSSFRNQHNRAANFTLEAFTIHTAWEPSHTDFESTVNVGYISVIQGAGVEYAESSAIPEQLTHVGGCTGSVCIVSVTLVNPFFHLVGDINR